MIRISVLLMLAAMSFLSCSKNDKEKIVARDRIDETVGVYQGIMSCDYYSKRGKSEDLKLNSNITYAVSIHTRKLTSGSMSILLPKALWFLHGDSAFNVMYDPANVTYHSSLILPDDYTTRAIYYRSDSLTIKQFRAIGKISADTMYTTSWTFGGKKYQF